MKPIAVWHHGLLSGPGIDPGHTLVILAEQLSALDQSGLAAAAREIHLGVNGSEEDELALCLVSPARSMIHCFPYGRSELSTLAALQRWLVPGWHVLYHHMKGANYPNNPVWYKWRRCMERVCVWNWEQCVAELDRGCDTVGAHWMTQERYPMIYDGQRYWGGNFWWATSDYLMTLPRVAADRPDRRYEAEVWIGQGPRAPRVRDFAPHFPMSCP